MQALKLECLKTEQTGRVRGVGFLCYNHRCFYYPSPQLLQDAHTYGVCVSVSVCLCVSTPAFCRHLLVPLRGSSTQGT